MVIYPDPLKTRLRAFYDAGFLQKPLKIPFFGGFAVFFGVGEQRTGDQEQKEWNRTERSGIKRRKEKIHHGRDQLHCTICPQRQTAS